MDQATAQSGGMQQLPAAKSHELQHGAQPPWLLSAATAGVGTCCLLIFQGCHSMGSQTTPACRGEGAVPPQLPESPLPPALYAAAYIHQLSTMMMLKQYCFGVLVRYIVICANL